MAAFEYLALSADGRRHKGVLEADSARQARQQLRERNLAPVQVEPVAARDGAANGSGGGRIGSADLALLTRQERKGKKDPLIQSLKVFYETNLKDQ